MKLKMLVLILALAGLLVSCGGSDDPTHTQQTVTTESAPTQEMGTEASQAPSKMHISYEEVLDGDEIILLGAISDETLRSNENFSWFGTAYEQYEPKKAIIDQMAESLSKSYVQIIMGTWCEDSHLHIPALFKILDQVEFDRGRMEMVAVNRDKNEPTSYLDNIDFEFVPTIIIYGDEGEIGRIVENPSNATLEEDLAAILQIK